MKTKSPIFSTTIFYTVLDANLNGVYKSKIVCLHRKVVDDLTLAHKMIEKKIDILPYHEFTVDKIEQFCC